MSFITENDIKVSGKRSAFELMFQVVNQSQRTSKASTTIGDYPIMGIGSLPAVHAFILERDSLKDYGPMVGNGIRRSLKHRIAIGKNEELAQQALDLLESFSTYRQGLGMNVVPTAPVETVPVETKAPTVTAASLKKLKKDDLVLALLSALNI